jgi:hypothetical protein
MEGPKHRRAVLAAIIALTVTTATSLIWAQSSSTSANSTSANSTSANSTSASSTSASSTAANSPTVKIGAVSQQAYAGALAQAESGLQRQIKFGSPVYALETVRTSESGST